ncbi:MAG: tol-pal system protein YbgF, partial [Lysobacteraceae bacterium]
AYQAALDALVERFEAADSARLFQAFLRDYPSSALVPNAYYWLGESYYVTQNYDLAQQAFQTLLSQHPGSRKEPDALLKLGYCQIALGQRAAGESTLRDVSSRYAGTDAAGKAASRLRTLATENR